MEFTDEERMEIGRAAGLNSELRSRAFVEWCLDRAREREEAALRSRYRWRLMALVGWSVAASLVAASVW